MAYGSTGGDGGGGGGGGEERKGRLPAGIGKKSNPPRDTLPMEEGQGGRRGDEGGAGKLDPALLHRLRQAWVRSDSKLQRFRTNLMDATKEMVGKNYSEFGTPHERPVNLIDLMVSTYESMLVPQEPRAMVSTQHPEYKRVAYDYGLAINHQAKNMKLKAVVRRAVNEALLGGLGVVKVGLSQSDTEIEVDGFLHDPGQTFCQNVNLDNFVFDMEADRWDLISFAGDQYSMPFKMVEESGLFDSEVVKRLKPDSRQDSATNAKTGGSKESIRELSAGKPDDQATLYDQIVLWDIWLPYEGLMVTLAANQHHLPPLRVVPWEGPEEGPYHLLSFKDVPGQVMPMSAVGNLMSLQKLINSIWRKLNRQADAAKTIYAFHGSAEEDAERLRDASDMSLVRKDSHHPVEVISTRGPDQQLIGLSGIIRDLFSYLCGNLDAIAGLGAAAETLGQERMIVASASKLFQKFMGKTLDFIRGVMGDIGLYVWTDPLVEIQLSKRVPGTDIDIPVVWDPDQREGQFPDYDIEVDPYSMVERTPQTEMQKLTMLVQDILPSTAQSAMLLQQVGVQLNVEAVVRVWAKYADMRDLDEVVAFGEMLEEEGGTEAVDPDPVGAEVEGVSPPSRTHRTYERINRPGVTQAGKDQAYQQMVAGANLQPSEAVQTVRQVG